LLEKRKAAPTRLTPSKHYQGRKSILKGGSRTLATKKKPEIVKKKDLFRKETRHLENKNDPLSEEREVLVPVKRKRHWRGQRGAGVLKRATTRGEKGELMAAEKPHQATWGGRKKKGDPSSKLKKVVSRKNEKGPRPLQSSGPKKRFLYLGKRRASGGRRKIWNFEKREIKKGCILAEKKKGHQIMSTRFRSRQSGNRR